MSVVRLWITAGVLAVAGAGCLLTYLVRRDGIEGAYLSRSPGAPRAAGFEPVAQSRADLFLGASVALAAAALLLMLISLLARRS